MVRARRASPRPSARLGLRSEASARFERGVDPCVIDAAIARFVELLRETSPTWQVAPGAVDARGVPARARRRRRCAPARVNALLGIELTDADIAAAHRADRLRRRRRPRPRRAAGRHPVAGGPTASRRSTSSRRWRASTATSASARRCRPRPTPARSRRASSDRRLLRQVMVGLGLAEAMPLPLLGPGDLPGPGWPRTPSRSPTRWPPRRACCARRCGRACCSPSPTTSRTATPASGCSSSATCSAAARPASRCPTSASCSTAVRAGADGHGRRGVVARAGAGPGARRCRARAPASSPACTRRAPRPSSRPTASVLGAVGEIDPGVLDAHGIAERVASLELDLERAAGRAPRRRAVPAGQPLPVERPRPRLRRPRRRCRPRRCGRSLGRCRRRAAVAGWSCSTSTAARAWPRGAAAWPTGCGSRRPTARSPTPTSPVVRDACIAAAAQVGAVIRG